MKTKRNSKKISSENLISLNNTQNNLHAKRPSTNEICEFIYSKNNSIINKNFDFSIESNNKFNQRINEKTHKKGNSSMDSSLLFPIVEKNIEFIVEENSIISNLKRKCGPIDTKDSLETLQIEINDKKRADSKLHESIVTINENSILNIKLNEDPNKDNFSIVYNNSITNNVNTQLISSYSININNNATSGYDHNFINSKNHNFTRRYDHNTINSIIYKQDIESVNLDNIEINNKLHYFSTDSNLINSIKIEPKFNVIQEKPVSKIELEKKIQPLLIKVNPINISITGIKKEDNLDKFESDILNYIPKILSKHNSKKNNYIKFNNKKEKIPPNSTPNKVKIVSRNRLSKSFEKIQEKAFSKGNLNKSDLMNEKTPIYKSNLEGITHRNVNKIGSINSVDKVLSVEKGNQKTNVSNTKISDFQLKLDITPKAKVNNKFNDFKEKRHSQKNMVKDNGKPFSSKYVFSNGKKENLKFKSKSPIRNYKDLDKKLNYQSKASPKINIIKIPYKVNYNKPTNLPTNLEKKQKNIRVYSKLAENVNVPSI